jgi:hypothetical protein
MKEVLQGLLKSKKFWVFTIMVAVTVVNRTLDIGLTAEDLAYIDGGGIAAILGFGMADHGKEKARIESGGE